MQASANSDFAAGFFKAPANLQTLIIVIIGIIVIIVIIIIIMIVIIIIVPKPTEPVSEPNFR